MHAVVNTSCKKVIAIKMFGMNEVLTIVGTPKSAHAPPVVNGGY